MSDTENQDEAESSDETENQAEAEGVADSVDEVTKGGMKFVKALFWIGVISGIAVGAIVYNQRQKLAAMSDDEIRELFAEKMDGRVPEEQLAQIQDAVIAKVRRQPSPGSASASITGTVAYREKIVMPPDAVVIVKLEDTSLKDVPAVEIGTQVIDTPGRVPVSYAILFDPGEIVDNHTYTVRATITSGDELLWTTDTAYPVITRGNPITADLLLVAVPAPADQ